MNKGRKSKSKKKKKAAAFDQSQPKAGGPPIFTSGFVEVRNSPVHGRGVFARTFIPKGTRVIEYLGERLSHKAADDRYEDHDVNDNHTFLFIVDKHTVIDAGVHGNDARFINHQCSGNCESVIAHRRVFINATRDIAAGEELGYDYEIGRDKDDPPNVDEIYACRCGSPKCRGTMLWPAKKTAVKRRTPKRLPKRLPPQARKSRRTQSQRRGERPRRRTPLVG